MKFFDKQLFCYRPDKAQTAVMPVIGYEYDEPKFKTLNEAGNGIFITFNSFGGAKRLQANLVAINAIAFDFDFDKEKNPIKIIPEDLERKKNDAVNSLKFNLCPSQIVYSKYGFHVYWFLKEPIVVTDENRNDWITRYHRLAAAMIEWSKQFGNLGDNTSDANRVLRLPGFFHHKGEPYLISREESYENRYDFEELENKFRGYYEKEVTYQSTNWKKTEFYADVLEEEVSKIDVKEVVAKFWEEQGHSVSWNKYNHLILDGIATATFADRRGGNYIATTSGEYPYKGPAIHYVWQAMRGEGIKTDALFEDAKQWVIAKFKIVINKKNQEIKVISHDELYKKEFPPQEWIVHNLIPKGGITAISGSSRSYKSWFSLLVALCASEGKRFLNQLDTSKIKTLYIDEENGDSLVHKRIHALHQEHANIHYAIWNQIKFSEESVNQLITIMKERGLELIIFDSFVRFLDPIRHNENDSAKMAEVSSLLRRFNKEGFTVIFIHHHRKENGMFKSDNNDKMRGSGDLIAQVDCHLMLERKDKIVTITQNKLRVDEEMEPFNMEVVKDEKGFITFRHNSMTEYQVLGMDEDVQKKIMELLDKDGELGIQQIMASLQITEKRCRAVLGRLENNGLLESKTQTVGEKGGTRKVYFINDITKLF